MEAQNSETDDLGGDTLVLESELGINNSKELYASLTSLSDRKADITLNAENVETVDTAALQLLLALVRAVKENGNQVVWEDPSIDLIQIASIAGLLEDLEIM